MPPNLYTESEVQALLTRHLNAHRLFSTSSPSPPPSEVTDLQHRLTTTQTIFAFTTTRCAHLTSSLNATNADLVLAKSKLASQDEKLDFANRWADDMMAKHKTLKEENEALKERNEALEREVEDLKRKVEKGEEDEEMFGVMVQEMEVMKGEWEGRLRRRDKMVSLLVGKVERRDEVIEALREKVERLESGGRRKRRDEKAGR
ncbi:hypothetical protein B9Z65_2677 [Elsinoe australis]|uniref:Autophagy-related protein 16 domain-containing protein n=1 Tax=Elsinoe australis TaxID=40998 RepID=A0A2P8A4D0_9PEZI|nr:hypothetical protein B9Z65_2677 [Elsinoe australis]